MMLALDLAKYIVSYYNDRKEIITNLGLQNILFQIQKEFFKKGYVAFYENFEAWGCGPVIPEVYYYYCGFGSLPLMNYEHIREQSAGLSNSDFTRTTKISHKKIVNEILEEMIPLGWYKCSWLEKYPGSAWDKAYHKNKREIISWSLIGE